MRFSRVSFRSFFDRLLVILLVALLAFGGLGLLVFPHVSFSALENRVLTTWRPPSASTLADGSFFRDFSHLCSDQFPFRRFFLSVKAQSERLLGKGENNGILFGADGYLIPRNDTPSLSLAARNLSAIATLAKEHPSLSLLVAPRSIDVHPQKLPPLYAPDSSLPDLVAQATPDVIFPLETLRAANTDASPVWYRTDHHWSTYGAYLAYRALLEHWGLSPLSADQFRVEVVSEDFLGSSFAAAGDFSGHIRKDRVLLYRHPDQERLRVTGASGEALSLYELSALSERDHYEVFLGGNHARLSVTSEGSSTRPRLLLVKDSFANSLIPFLALHYDLDVIDPRYGAHTLPSLLAEGEYDRILFLFGLDTLANDASLQTFLCGNG